MRTLSGLLGLGPVLVGSLVFTSCETAPDEALPLPEVPKTKTVDQVDDYHGTEVSDPYRWLEEIDDPEVSDWVDGQNVRTRAFLDGVAERDEIASRLGELWVYERRSVPVQRGDQTFQLRNDGTQDQAVLYVGDRVLLDPNTLSDEGTTSLSSFHPSLDGSMVACAISEAGSDWIEWRILRTADGSESGERLRFSKFSGAAWTKDGAGFFYQRYPAPPEGAELEAENRTPSLCYHAVGTEQAEDRVVYERPDRPDWGYAPLVSDDGSHCVVQVWLGTDSRNGILLIDLSDESMPVSPLLLDFDARWDFIELIGGEEEGPLEALFVSDDGAPNAQIVAVDVAATQAMLANPPVPEIDPETLEPIPVPPLRQVRVVVPEGPDALASVQLLGGRLVVQRLHDAAHTIALHELDGSLSTEIDLPSALGTVGSIEGRREDPLLRFSFQSIDRPSSVFSYDIESGESAVEFEPDLPFDPSAIELRQVPFIGPGGVSLRLLLAHRPGIRLDGSNPTLLYGYGGFDISVTPTFSVERFVFCERGGVFALATLRGGGEFGQAWHEAGMRGNKQNVFDDFEASARYLIRNGYTTPSRLAINGRSNGGLLAGALLTQHPELFGAAIPEVGVLDMLRYHKFTIGWAWEPEYGSADDPEMFPVLYDYSPLHNIEAGANYPPTLITTGDHDDRVLPAHSYKFAAALQAGQGGEDPILIRITRSAGHGAGKPTSIQIDEAADRLAFLTETIGLGR